MLKCDICTAPTNPQHPLARKITHVQLKEAPRLIAHAFRVKAKTEMRGKSPEFLAEAALLWLSQVEANFGQSDWLLCPDCAFVFFEATRFTIAVLFDKNRLNEGSTPAWTALYRFMQHTSQRRLAGFFWPTLLSMGDTDATLANRAETFCIQVETDSPRVAAYLEGRFAYQKAEGIQILRQAVAGSFVPFARVNADGTFDPLRDWEEPCRKLQAKAHWVVQGERFLDTPLAAMYADGFQLATWWTPSVVFANLCPCGELIVVKEVDGGVKQCARCKTMHMFEADWAWYRTPYQAKSCECGRTVRAGSNQLGMRVSCEQCGAPHMVAEEWDHHCPSCEIVLPRNLSECPVCLLKRLPCVECGTTFEIGLGASIVSSRPLPKFIGERGPGEDDPDSPVKPVKFIVGTKNAGDSEDRRRSRLALKQAAMDLTQFWECENCNCRQTFEESLTRSHALPPSPVATAEEEAVPEVQVDPVARLKSSLARIRMRQSIRRFYDSINLGSPPFGRHLAGLLASIFAFVSTLGLMIVMGASLLPALLVGIVVFSIAFALSEFLVIVPSDDALAERRAELEGKLAELEASAAAALADSQKKPSPANAMLGEKLRVTFEEMLHKDMPETSNSQPRMKSKPGREESSPRSDDSAPTTTKAAQLRFTCPKCSRVVHAPAESAGKKARCPGCQEIIPIPKL